MQFFYSAIPGAFLASCHYKNSNHPRQEGVKSRNAFKVLYGTYYTMYSGNDPAKLIRQLFGYLSIFEHLNEIIKQFDFKI